MALPNQGERFGGQYIASVGLKHGKPVIAPGEGKAQAEIDDGGHSITDERFGDPDIAH